MLISFYQSTKQMAESTTAMTKENNPNSYAIYYPIGCDGLKDKHCISTSKFFYKLLHYIKIQKKKLNIYYEDKKQYFLEKVIKEFKETTVQEKEQIKEDVIIYLLCVYLYEYYNYLDPEKQKLVTEQMRTKEFNNNDTNSNKLTNEEKKFKDEEFNQTILMREEVFYYLIWKYLLLNQQIADNYQECFKEIKKNIAKKGDEFQYKKLKTKMSTELLNQILVDIDEKLKSFDTINKSETGLKLYKKDKPSVIPAVLSLGGVGSIVGLIAARKQRKKKKKGVKSTKKKKKFESLKRSQKTKKN